MQSLLAFLNELKEEIKGSSSIDIRSIHSINEIEIIINWKDDFHYIRRFKEKEILSYENDDSDLLKRFIKEANIVRKKHKAINHRIQG